MIPQLETQAYKNKNPQYSQKIITSYQLKFKCAMNNTTFELAYDNTFIISHWDEKHIFKHIDSVGSIIQVLELSIKNVRHHLMISENELIIVCTEENQNRDKIILWNIKTKSCISTTIKFQFNYSLSNVHGNQIFFFKDTNYICHCQSVGGRKFKLSYFEMPLRQGDKPFHQYTYDKYFEVTVPMRKFFKLTKLNEKSMIGFMPQHCLTLFSPYFELDAFEMYNQQKSGTVLQLKTKFELGLDKFPFLTARITDIWEVHPQIFYIQIKTQINISLYKIEDYEKNPHNLQNHYNLYWNYKNNGTQVGKIIIAEPHRVQFVHSIRQINYLDRQIWTLEKRIQQFHHLHSDYLRMPEEVIVPIYYVDLGKQTILERVGGRTSKICQFRQSWPEYKCSQMFEIQSIRKQGDSDPIGSGVVVRVKKYPIRWHIFEVGIKMVITFMLNEMIRQCDDDLAIEISKLNSQ